MTRGLIVATLCALFAQSVGAQVNLDKYRSYFLVGEFGEVCTMCEVIVLCEVTDAMPAHDAIPAGGAFTLYHLQTRTFWSQVSTIWEWFVANFSSESLAQGHTRPVWIYEVADGRWSGPEIVEAHIALEPPRLTFGERAIDRRNRAWLSGTTTVGYCQRLPLWESLDVIAAHAAAGAGP